MGDLHALRQIAKALRDLVGKGLRRHTGSRRGLLDLLAVLVGAGQEAHPPAVEAREPGEGIAGQRGVGVADMGHVVDVVDRRGDVEGVSR